MTAGSPVVVRLAPGVTDAIAALADVIVVDGDGRPAGPWCRELFGRYPGLTIVAVRCGGGWLLLGTRDGRLVRTRGGAAVAARLLYRRGQASPGGSARFRCAGRWGAGLTERCEPPP